MMLDLASIKGLLKPRTLAANKWDFGHVLVIAGDEGMPGAARLAAEAALVSGAGLVTLATHPSHASFITVMRPEIMTHAVTSVSVLESLMARADVLVAGPGMQGEWSKVCLEVVIHSSLPKVLDAGALNNLAERGEFSLKKALLTPHEQEAARLLKQSAQNIHQHRTESALALAKQYQSTVILKGHHTVIAEPDSESTHICPYGSPAMASPGMGDVLAGILGGLIAQGLSLQDAAKLGCCVHGKAGELAHQAIPGPNVLASEIFPWVRKLLAEH
ncbi:MAG: NAD(P)H-hydrate dehydratase [Gammaproteobacteria bacterium]|nr:NAD(P)H-hydrate dehydratase [Gammaproteobacteria bacterium]